MTEYIGNFKQFLFFDMTRQYKNVLLNQTWEKINDNMFTCKSFYEYEIYDVFGVHLPTLYAIYDIGKATGHFPSLSKRFDYHVEYYKKEQAFFVAVVLCLNGQEIFRADSDGYFEDFMQLFTE